MPARKQKSGTLICNQSFATNENGRPRVVRKGTAIAAADPVVKGREHLFDTAEDAVRGPVEQATAAPGEKRTAAKKTAPSSSDTPSDD